MKLLDYITGQKLNVAEAARDMERKPQAVHFWATGQRKPRDEDMIHIYRWSKGMVQPNDFYDLPDLEEEARANEPVSQPVHEAAA